MAEFKRIGLLLSVASLALSMPADSSSSTAARLAIREDPVYPWVAIGDSFSAGPGAGKPFGDEISGDCFRNDGSYPAQLNKDFPYPNNGMQFLSCTGAVTSDMIATQIPNMDKDQQVITVSIGGNDVGFGKILKACVFKPGGPFSDDCDETINSVRKWLDDNKLRDVLKKGYDAIIERLDRGNKRTIFVQLYPGFFGEGPGTEWCNSQSMGIIPGYKPLLTNELRHTLNRLAEYVRDEIKQFLERYNGGLRWDQPRIFYMDDFDLDTYETHRFCEKGRETLDDPDIWFFTIGGNDSPQTMTAQDVLSKYDPGKCTQDAKYQTDFAYGWYCDTARYVASLSDSDKGNFRTYAPESVTKAFHPKTAAFTSIKNKHKEAIQRLAWPREVSHDLGNLQCQPPGRKQDDPEFFATREDIIKASEMFCDSMHSSGVKPGLIEGVYNKMIVSASWNDAAKDCPTLDVTSNGFVDMCNSRLLRPIDACDLEKRANLWKQGGGFYRDCITWYIGRQPYDKKPSVSAANATRV
ncbi:uncharacterized protein E0L32_001631 [Thyridium curvatum]|uniref:SGNH hydrolase-type esterase domain-containing protein n=1 Tax=Thyridium curvatum TaxID=1093900 RepID=A0A507AW78_9PEZI|nr:uncharacterized protein E0L32_001566 [Thyridium curvatum]XP_030990882.1 uncharacterized protein E0L32_001631 [Thyridium curvatum]TPX09106.1 hypothetical protein E0L32_001566 [Thyridium curvatum]TPX09171.1 hypothetical protein E0L32_001631 [Thyridium curvatum]